MKKVVLLFSSGLDSYLANHKLLTYKDLEVHRIYFDLNTVYSKHEKDIIFKRYVTPGGMSKLEDTVYMCDRFDMGFLERANSYVPNRNLMLVTAASAMFNDADEVYINSMKDDRVQDSDRELFEEYSPVLSKSIGKEVKIKSLFWNIEKADAVRHYITDGGVKLNLLLHTYSCFSMVLLERLLPVRTGLDTPSGPMYNSIGDFYITGCLECAACFRRACALTAVNLYIPFFDKELARSYLTSVNEEIHPSRFETIQKYNEFLEYDETEKRVSL